MINSTAQRHDATAIDQMTDDGVAENSVTICHAQRTLSFLQDKQVAPVPVAYEVFYHYLNSADEMMTHQIDLLLDSGEPIDLEDLKRLHEQYFVEPYSVSERHDDLFACVEDEISSFSRLVTVYLSSNEGYSGELDRSVEGLQVGIKPNRIRETIEKILIENKKMRRDTEVMAAHLEQSRGEIRAVRRSLAEAQEKVFCDPLTGLGNRRKFDMMLAQEIAAARQNKTDLCLAIADIDHFKRVNDSFGHPVGDAVIRFFGELLLDNIKGRDIATRYGGEEFAIILPFTTLNDAAQLMDGIRTELENAEFMVNQSGQPLGALTVSLGVTILRHDECQTALVERADSLLYRAKNSGRNQVAAG